MKYPLPKVEYVSPKKLDGDCGEWIPSGTSRPGFIRIANNMKPLDTMDTLIHELLHEHFQDITEDKILFTASRMAEVLWREGYRKVIQ